MTFTIQDFDSRDAYFRWRRKQAAMWRAAGLTYREIGQRLGVSSTQAQACIRQHEWHKRSEARLTSLKLARLREINHHAIRKYCLSLCHRCSIEDLIFNFGMEDKVDIPQGKLLKEKEVALLLNIRVTTLRRWRWTGQGPKFIKLGAAVRYDPRHIEEFIGRPQQSTLESEAI